MELAARHFVTLLIVSLTSVVCLSEKTAEKQYAEAYAPEDQSVQFEVSSLREENSDLNTVVVKHLKEKKIPLSAPKLLKRIENEEGFVDLTEPYVASEEYYAVQPEMLGRQKRDLGVPAWQELYRRRFMAYAQKTRRNRCPGGRGCRKDRRTKFARQFAGDETAFQDDNTIDNMQQLITQPPRDNQDADFDVTTPTTTTTTEEETTTRRHKKHKKRTTTTTTTSAPQDDEPYVTEEVTKKSRTTTKAAAIRTPSRNAKNNDLESIVMALSQDLLGGGHYVPKKGEKMPLWAKPELDGELYPMKNKELKQMIVDKHNVLRAAVSPPAANMLKMEWNEEAAHVAQYWAEQCHFEHDAGEVRKTSRFSCGQNLARGWPSPLSWNLTMQLWFDEYKDFTYDGQKSQQTGIVGHYTALVWATSYQVGCGYANCGTFHHYVCNYCPSGNIDVRRYLPYKKASKACAACPNDCDESGKLCTNTCKHSNKYGNCDDLQKEFQICTDSSYGLADKCEATCKCQGKIY